MTVLRNIVFADISDSGNDQITIHGQFMQKSNKMHSECKGAIAFSCNCTVHILICLIVLNNC